MEHASAGGHNVTYSFVQNSRIHEAVVAFVYRLIDPRNQQCFYIGVTENHVRRLDEHNKGRCVTSAGYIEEIKMAGLLPIIEILFELPTKEAHKVERALIIAHRKAKIAIANNVFGTKRPSKLTLHGTRWNDLSRAELGRLFQSGMKLKAIGVELGRTQRAIKIELVRMGLLSESPDQSDVP